MAGTAKTKAQLNTQTDSTIYNNDSNLIEATDHNQLLLDIIASYVNLTDAASLFATRANIVSVTTAGTAITFSSALGSAGTDYALSVFCYDASGDSIDVRITSRTANGFTATPAINGTLDYIAKLNV